MIVCEERATYTAPAKSVYDDWNGYQRPGYQPTERQLIVIAAVQSALNAGCYYTDEVRIHCASLLSVTPEQAQVNAKVVEGGEFGMDCYYARGYLRAQKEIQAESRAWLQLAPRVGQALGTVMFNDFKRMTGAMVAAVDEAAQMITVHGKRGKYAYQSSCSAMQIRNAIDRAKEQGHRKDGFDRAFPPAAS